MIGASHPLESGESSDLPVLLVLYVVGYQEYIIFIAIRKKKALWQTDEK